MDLPFPNQKSLTELLTMLFGKSVPMKPLKPAPVTATAAAPVFAGFFTADGESQASAVMVADFPLALAAGGALAMIAPGVVADCLKTKEMPENLQTNLNEVMNISASLFNDDGAPHMRLTSMSRYNASPAADLQSLVANAKSRLDLEVTIAPYASGKLTLLRS